MSVVTSDGATLRAFAAEVTAVAEEVIEEVLPVVLAVAGGILCEAEPGTVGLQAVEGEAGILWATFAGRRMAFRYNPMTAMIEMREDTLDGHPARIFGRRSLQMDIVNFFGAQHVEDGPDGVTDRT